ncbi:YncE family protein [Rhodococcus sp. NPDC059968]|uniref:YncE family protein n=1 Tax=Rhodococcus sp. NPDC059968 TaxID=3347017 RepID=UPI00366BE738
MILTVAACGQSRSDSAVDDAPVGNPTVTATVSVGEGPLLDVTVDPSTGTTYVTSSRDDLLSMIAADGGISAIEVGRAPAGVAMDPSTHTAYVTSLAEGAVSVVDIASRVVTATIPVGAAPQGIDGDPSTHTLYVANVDDGSVSVIDTETRTVSATVEVGNRPGGMGVDPSTHALYVATTGLN